MIERNQVLVGLVVTALLGVGTFFAITLTGNVFVSGPEMTARFEDAAGLNADDFVLVSGVKVGEVTSVEIDDGTALATFTIDAEGKVPVDSMANLTIRNTLGKRAIAFTPGESDEFLADGDEIPLEQTSTPVDLPELGDRSAELLGGVDVDALDDLVTSLADVTDGNKQDVEQLLDGVQQVSGIVTDRREEIAGVLERGEELVDAAADRDQEIVQIIDEFGSTLDVLVERRTDITRLLREAALTSNITSDLLEDRRGQIDEVLFELHEDLEIVDDHQVDLAHILASAGVGVEGFASIGYQGGDDVREDTPDWGNVFVTGLGQVGIDALLGCGGPIDDAFTELIGPDPGCEENGNRPSGPEDDPPDDDSDTDDDGSSDSEPGGGSDDGSDGGGPLDDLDDDPLSYGRLDSFFTFGDGGDQ